MGSSGTPMIGGLFSAGGSIMQADDQSKMLDDEANTAAINAKRVREGGKLNAERQQITAEKIFGGMSADYAASGVTQDSGSVMEVLRESHTNAELDRLNIIHGAELKAQDLEERSRMASQGATRARQMGTFNAFTSLFMGGMKSAEDPPPEPRRKGGGGGNYGNSGDSYSDYGSTT